MREVGAEQVALGGDGGEAGTGVDQFLGVLEGADDDDAVQKPSYGGHEVVGTADETLRGEGVPEGAAGASAVGAASAASGNRPVTRRAARPASCLRSSRIASAAADGEDTARASAAAPNAAASGTS